MKKRLILSIVLLVIVFLLVLGVVYAPPPTTPPPGPGSLDGGNGGDGTPTIDLPTCDDGVKNQNETGVDCGGSCVACDSGDISTGNDTSSQDDTDDVGDTTSSIDTSSGGVSAGGQTDSLTGLSDEDLKKIIEMYAPQKSGWLSNISILINSFLVVVLVSFVLYNNLQIKKIKSKPQRRLKRIPKRVPIRRDISLERLRFYIGNNLKRGYSPYQIKQGLLRQNWTPQKIEEAFRAFRRR